MLSVCVHNVYLSILRCLVETDSAFCLYEDEDDESSTNLKMIIPVAVLCILFAIAIIIIAVWAVRKGRLNKPYVSTNGYLMKVGLGGEGGGSPAFAIQSKVLSHVRYSLREILHKCNTLLCFVLIR